MDTSNLERILGDEHAHRTAGGAPRMMALSTAEIGMLRIAVASHRAVGTIAVPVPVGVGEDEGGMIVLAYEKTEANKEMARRVAVAMFEADEDGDGAG